MEKNIGFIDKIIRLMLVLLYLVAYQNDWIGGNFAIVLGLFASIFFVTSLVNSCPLYSVFGINTSQPT